MKFIIESGTPVDIDELEMLYDDLNDYLAATTNYPGWIKGIYPIRKNAVSGIQDNNLFVVRHDDKIAGYVYENNLPAISLYEKCGFKYIDTVDLGLGNYGLDWFKLYEKVV